MAPTNTHLESRLRTAADAREVAGFGPDVRSVAAHRGVRTALVDDPAEPEVVAEFAVPLLAIRNNDGRLADWEPAAKGRLSRWVLWGTLIATQDGVLALGSLRIDSGTNRDRDVQSRGVTAELLRLVRPAEIATEALSELRRVERAERRRLKRDGATMPAERERAFDRLRDLRLAAAATPEAQLRAIAEDYCYLTAQGQTRPLLELKERFGLTRDQTRDRIRRARELGYLEPGRPGRAEGIPGPRLVAVRPGLKKALAAMRRDAATTKGGSNG